MDQRLPTVYDTPRALLPESTSAYLRLSVLMGFFAHFSEVILNFVPN